MAKTGLATAPAIQAGFTDDRELTGTSGLVEEGVAIPPAPDAGLDLLPLVVCLEVTVLVGIASIPAIGIEEATALAKDSLISRKAV